VEDLSMTCIIEDMERVELFAEPARIIAGARKAVAITGAGISVESGVPDFRSPGGLWETFDPQIWRTLEGTEPNAGHRALAELEDRGILKTVITQNVDGLHQKAGSRCVIEVHGGHFRVECLQCGADFPVGEEHVRGTGVPRCGNCGFQLKPTVVLFGAAIRGYGEIEDALAGCDVLLVVGTSAQVYPVASFPRRVKSGGGVVLEFNREETPLTGSCADYLFRGSAGASLPAIVGAL
jgi:NAD-dependent deacetylase